MLITILATGSTGDTLPYIAFGLALKKAGLVVRFATFQNYEALIKSYGLEYYPITGDVTLAASSATGQEAMQADNPLKLLISFTKLKALVQDAQKELFEACKGADLIIYHPGCAIGYFAAQEFNIPSVLATPFPMTPTNEYPSLIFYDFPELGKGFNLLSHKVFEGIMWMASASPIRDFWKKEFGHSPKNFSCPFPKQTSQRYPTIISCSDYVFPKPKDFPKHVTNSGYWFLEDEGDWMPSPELSRFLENGKPPIYIGFGSLGKSSDSLETTEMIISALKNSKQRGILATGWGGISDLKQVPEEVFILNKAPHSWLFPRMAAVVHHGGAGTTAAGLHAGVPSIIVPFSNDQFAWGKRVFELGVAAKPIPRKVLTSEKLSDTILFALSSPIQETAKNLGAQIRSENGTEAAVKIIQACFSS
jgi:sterol 3beta-glucosyltransferase